MFRPYARVTDPHGREWEIYASKLALPKRGAPDPTRAEGWTIEAISWAPFRASYTWTTTLEHRGQVLAQVEGGLARGERPRPRNAQFVASD